jgi:hypothetical protein
MTTATQKIQEAANQLNQALLQKDMLSEQLEQVNERVKALRNLLAGVDIGRQIAAEQAKDADPRPDMAE